ncbi:MAG: aspartate carbamoyltransferase, partial [candidate division WOR-3 bacterium]
MRSKDLLGIELLTREEIAAILDQAGIFRRMLDKSIPIKPALRGKRIVNLFFEPSSKRTATSFCLAAR